MPAKFPHAEPARRHGYAVAFGMELDEAERRLAELELDRLNGGLRQADFYLLVGLRARFARTASGRSVRRLNARFAYCVQDSIALASRRSDDREAGR